MDGTINPEFEFCYNNEILQNFCLKITGWFFGASLLLYLQYLVLSGRNSAKMLEFDRVLKLSMTAQTSRSIAKKHGKYFFDFNLMLGDGNLEFPCWDQPGIGASIRLLLKNNLSKRQKNVNFSQKTSIFRASIVTRSVGTLCIL